MQIGRVKAIKLLDENGVDLTLELNAEHRVRAGEQPVIDVGSLITGDAVVEFMSPTPEQLLVRFDGAGGSPANGMLDENEALLASAQLKAGDFMSGGRVAPNPLDSLLDMQNSFARTLNTLDQAGTQITGLTQDVRRLLGSSDSEIQKLSRQVEATILNFNETLDSVEGLFSDPNLQSALETIATRLPDLVDDTQGVVVQAKQTLAAFEGAGREAEQTMRNVSVLTKPLAEQGDQIVADALRSLNNLDGLLMDLRQLAARVNSSQGTVGKLLDDDRMYYEIINTLQNVEQITRRLEPIIADARIFTDKVARDPARAIDLRGVITGRPSGGIK